jgi:hypothetical protein
MTWLTWRQQRIQTYVGAAVLAAFAVLMVITGLQMASQYHDAIAACTATHSCVNQGGLFLGNRAVGFLVIMTLGAPVLVGLFWGAPLIAAELETGTTRFAWMQSVTRKRWFGVKAGWALVAAVVWGGVISGLVTWWSGPNNALHRDAFNPGRFDIMYITPVGYALFAMALGICAGVLLRRTLPAIAVTLAGFIGVRAAIALWLRPHYMHAVTTTYSVLGGYTPAGSYWQLAQGIRTPGGQVVPQPNGLAAFNIPSDYLPRACAALTQRGSHITPSCRAALDGFRGFITYQPASRYWAFQGIETGIFIALAAILVTVAAVVLLRSDG